MTRHPRPPLHLTSPRRLRAQDRERGEAECTGGCGQQSTAVRLQEMSLFHFSAFPSG
jgi:hypothetical protein